MSFNDTWFIVTAGHVLKGLDELISSRKIQLISSSIADYFGKDAKVHLPTPFPYDVDTPKGWIDDNAIGLDLGLIHVRPLFRQGLQANGILPISEENWVRQNDVDFELYYLLGFPKELADKLTKPVDRGKEMTAHVLPGLFKVERIWDSSEVPSYVEIPDATLPWFVGKLTATTGPDIKGTSGGPILGIRKTPDGGLQYWVVALQSAWYPDSRIIRGCPVPIFARIVQELLNEHGLTDENIT
jgi:hypothetical protein